MLGPRSRRNDAQTRFELVEHGPASHGEAKVEIEKKLAAPAADPSCNLGDRHLIERAVAGHQSLKGLQRNVGLRVIDDALNQAQVQMCEEEDWDRALKNDNANGITLRGQPARELVELAEQDRIHQVDRVVVNRHTGDSRLDADVKGRQIRRTY